MKVLFEAIEVTKQFANHRALSQVSITVPEQSIYGLLGPNGAGKTTLIRIINQINAPDSGKLLFHSSKLKPEDTSRIGYLPEERGLYKKMQVGEQSLYLAQLKGLSKQEAAKRLKLWFEKFEIQPWWNRKVEELSKGMQQKVQFIVTVIHEPELLIFDEPFSGFDPINVNLIKDEILELRKKGSTIIFSTHNMASVEELCDHIALIDKSKKILEGNMKDIRNAYKSNTFEIGFKGKSDDLNKLLDDQYTVTQQHSEGEKSKATIQLLNGKTQNDLLSELLPHVTILSFNEILPTMNDIFINKVNENKKL
jgi:ABC-2 type transport system ATP-binding protein